MFGRLMIRPRQFHLPHAQHRLHRLRSISSDASQPSRITRIESRLPKFLQRIVAPIRNAPISHVTSFLILHEITAILPLFGLAAAFHYGNWLPPLIGEGKWAKEGAEKYGRWLRRKGWIKEDSTSDKWWGRGEGGIRLVVEFATAYALTKALLPLRLIVSVWATPWFARSTILPLTTRIGRRFGKGKSPSATTVSPGAGTNATGGGAISKSQK